MFAKALHQVSLSWPACRWSSLALALAIVGTTLPVTGWQVSAQLQNLGHVSGSCDEGQNEFPGEQQDGEHEASPQLQGPSRKPLRPRPVGVLVVTGDSACFRHALQNDRDAADFSSARLPLRC